MHFAFHLPQGAQVNAQKHVHVGYLFIHALYPINDLVVKLLLSDNTIETNTLYTI
jgi:hypothetical protein